MCLLSGSNKNVTREYVLELLKYNNKRNLFEKLHVWTVPSFPINGQMLQANGCSVGKEIGHVKNKLMAIWCKNNFRMSSEDLLKELPTVLKELKERDYEMVKKKPKIN